jgi:hypothetical protein
MDEQDRVDEILGIVRCVRCGHRLDSEIECPFCSLFPDPPRSNVFPKWLFITACFLTSPVSIYFVVTSPRLNIFEKLFALSGCLLWCGLYFVFF